MSKIARRRLPRLPGPSAQYAMFGPPPLIQGEDGAAYDELLARISGAINPTDSIEEMLVRDVVDLCWLALRLQRIEAALVTEAVNSELASFLTGALVADEEDEPNFHVRWDDARA